MDPATVLSSLRALGGRLPRTLVVGCVPADLDEGIGLSPVVAAAVEPAATTVRALLASELAATPAGAGRTEGG
jgi:hydrogenase maturation protease